MATISKPLGLRTDPLSLIPKKYRGEADDPHFIPDSPLIQRQMLTEQEEGDLKRICALVLANVQHSDDMSDDPLKYLVAHIQEGRAQVHGEKEVSQEQRPEARIQSTDANVTHEILLDLHNDTAPSSEASHRDTFSSTDYSTPRTSAGFTPRGTARRLSDTTRKSITSTKRTGSSLRNETVSITKSRKTSTAGLHGPLEASKPSVEAEPVKRILRIVPVEAAPPPLGSREIRSMDIHRESRFSVPNLNKDLPLPPPHDTPVVVDDEKQPHISRLIKKTIRKKKSMTTDEGRNLSTVSAPPVPVAADALKHPTQPTAIRPQPAQVESSPKKRFRLRLFSRRQRPADILVT
ncbi:hypothetical protein H2202_000450 [Exophiala xenobiotica]|nr:hypothetical protein H2202_000450 [Exophiala xenobiotica]KAK5211589.1 hypothetical protein LTR41_003050 [Exophiala xenobiotica]KAK5222664.1 hypothetical protein LTR72_005501 [Exophiala xenobiotica]KAK5233689.1 hypothetical protein LTR47_005312 [Exophiala xenobiotica]KAK5247983.1 hypothetical protein LTS06_006972 [Exophiala xenobiotica]